MRAPSELLVVHSMRPLTVDLVADDVVGAVAGGVAAAAGKLGLDVMTVARDVAVGAGRAGLDALDLRGRLRAVARRCERRSGALSQAAQVALGWGGRAVP